MIFFNRYQSLLMKKVAKMVKSNTVAAFGNHERKPGTFPIMSCRIDAILVAIKVPKSLILVIIVSCCKSLKFRKKAADLLP